MCDIPAAEPAASRRPDSPTWRMSVSWCGAGQRKGDDMGSSPGMTHQRFSRYHPDHTLPPADDASWVWVFGSNLAGRHGAGAAKVAKVSFGAVYGHGRGPTGRAYAIPTKDGSLKVLELAQIEKSIEDFVLYASIHPEKLFFVTRVGCGLAGHDDALIAPLFAAAPPNCSLPIDWKMFTAARPDLF